MPDATPISALASPFSMNGQQPVSAVPAAPGSVGANGAAIPPPALAAPATLSPTDEDKLLAALVRNFRRDPAKIEFESLDKELALVNHVIREFEDADAGSNKYKQNVAELWATWRGATNPKTFPFEGASNVIVPLTSVFVETMVARTFKAITGGDFIAKVSVMDKEVASDDLDSMNKWFKWELEEIVNIRKCLVDTLRNLFITGIAVVVPSYENDTRYLHTQREFDIDTTKSLSQVVADANDAIVNTPSDWGTEEPLAIVKDNGKGELKLSDGGRVVYSLDEEAQNRLIADIWKRETIFNGVRLHQVNLEDLVVANTAQAIDDLPGFGIRCWYSVDKYREKLEDGYFIDLGEEENNRVVGAADTKTGEAIDQPITNFQDREEGTDSTGSSITSDANRRFIEVYRWEGWWDLRNSTNEENIDRSLKPRIQIAVWVATRSRRVVRIKRLEDLNKDGKRSGCKFGFIEEPGRFYPMGVAEWVKHSQSEIDAIHNLRLDAGLLYNIPFGFYKPVAGTGKEAKPINIKVGMFYPSAEPAGVNMPRSNWQPSFSFAEEQLVKGYANEQIGLSGAATGSPLNKRQTASEFVGIANALDLRSELFVEQFLTSLRELFYRILGLYQQFAPRQRIFRVSGEGGVELTKRFERDRLQGKLLLHMAGNLQQINEQLQKQVALNMLQLLLNPLLLQLQIVGPDTIWAAIDKLARASHYEDVPIHKPLTPQVSDAPEVEEHQIFAGTKPIGPTMGENFQEHMAHHARTAADARLMESWSPTARQALSDHMMATMQMEQQQIIAARARMQLAAQMQQSMAGKGIRPGQAGSQNPDESLGAGTEAEGVEGAGAGASAPTAMAA